MENPPENSLEVFERRKQRVEEHLQRSLQRLEKAIGNLPKEKEQFLQWEILQHEALLLQSNLYQIKRGMSQVVVQDWNQEGKEILLAIDPKLDPSEHIVKRVKQARKWKGGLEHLGLREKKLLKQKQIIQERLIQLEGVCSFGELESFCKACRIQLEPRIKGAHQEVKLPYRIYRIGCWEIWAGLSGRDNDRLTFQYANGLDYWFHVSGISGSHIVLKHQKGKEPDDAAINAAVQLALHHSKARLHGEGEVVMTQCKYVRRFGKGQPGKVQISNPRTYFAKYDKQFIASNLLL